MKTTEETVKNESEELRTFLIKTDREEFQIDIPAGWKVTFGNFNPGSKYSEGTALRIYEAQDKQRACFLNVKEFRDLSLPLRKKIVETKAVRLEEKKKNTQTSFADTERIETWVQE